MRQVNNEILVESSEYISNILRFHSILKARTQHHNISSMLKINHSKLRSLVVNLSLLSDYL